MVAISTSWGGKLPIKKRPPSLRLTNVGPITDARVSFGDLTVLVGPQASGKSVFLQTLKLVMDRNHVLGFFEQQNTVFRGDARNVLSGYYGRGMGGMLDSDPGPSITWASQSYKLEDLTRFKKPKKEQPEALFYIPAQRVVSLPSGRTQTFGSFEFGDPFVLRYFSHQLHVLLQNEFGGNSDLFPAKGRLNEYLREPIARYIFADSLLRIEPRDFTKTMHLSVDGLEEGLPYLAWSAGQREFVPLLLGVYWLCPAGKVSRRDGVRWVVIEEPEMGLHPQAIEAFLIIVLELMRRGYRVVISTHSPVVLDLIWGIETIKELGGIEDDVRQFLSLRSSGFTKDLCKSALSKGYKAFYFSREGVSRDISALDPSHEDPAISNWGYLTGFSSRASEVISQVALRKSLGDILDV